MRKEQTVKISMNKVTSQKENYRIVKRYLKEESKRGKHILMKHEINI